MVKVGGGQPVVGRQDDAAVAHAQHVCRLQAPREGWVVCDRHQRAIVLLQAIPDLLVLHSCRSHALAFNCLYVRKCFKLQHIMQITEHCGPEPTPPA